MTATRSRPATKLPADTTSNQFWMVREGTSYLFFRFNRKPTLKPLKYSWEPDKVFGTTYGDKYTVMLCVPQVHRLFPGLGRHKVGDLPKLVTISMEPGS